MNKHELFIEQNPLSVLPPIPGKGWYVYSVGCDVWYKVAWFQDGEDDLVLGIEEPRGQRYGGFWGVRAGEGAWWVARLKPETGRYGFLKIGPGDRLEYVA